MSKNEVVESVPMKPSISLNESDASFLKGKTVGDKINLRVKGEVVEVRKPDSYEKEKTPFYRIELSNITNKGSARV